MSETHEPSDRSDSHAWLLAQAEALRKVAALRPNLPIPIDWEGIAEELEAVAAAQRNELKSRLLVLMQHLMKLAHVPMIEPRNGWQRTVREQRDRLGFLFEESPSLRPRAAEEAGRLWPKARREVVADYRLRSLPERCPWTIEQILAEDWWPSEPEALREEPVVAG